MIIPVLKSSGLPSPVPGEGEGWMTSFAGEVREARTRFLKELEAAHLAGGSGLEIARACSAAIETVVLQFHGALEAWMGGKLRRRPAVIALGGLGRRELSPRSDVDLLFLWDKKPGPAGTAFAGYLVRMLWDAGLEIGSSMHTAVDLRKALERDIGLETAILDARWMCGDERVAREFEAIRAGRSRGTILEAKLEETRRRWGKQGWTFRLIEPNVRESPGGLLDHQMMRWAGTALPWQGPFEGLRRLAVLDREETGEMERAFDFIVRARNDLHFRMGTNWNVLTVEQQRATAKRLGYARAGRSSAAERFMRDYYAMARAIHAPLRRLLEETAGEGSLRIIGGAIYRRVGTRGLGRLEIPMGRARMAAEPLFAFQEQVRTGRRLSSRTGQRIRNAFAAKRLDRRVMKRLRASFIDLLGMNGRKAPALRDMHELGVLRHLFPPFDDLSSLEKYDLYHQFTADEHSLQAVANLDELAASEGGLLARIYDEIAEKTELVLAMLLHDIGRPNTRGHARSGARMADDLLRSFPVSPASRELVSFLVRNHLLLSHYSQRRDMEDLDTSLRFAKTVRNRLNLKLLYLLTYADLKATGPSVWTAWKENLLEDLYFKASRMLAEQSEPAGAYRANVERRTEKILALCRTDEDRAAMEIHLANLPERYAMTVTPAQAAAHVAMVNRLRGRIAVVEVTRRKHALEVAVCTRDRPFRLSQLCGALTIIDLNILGVSAFTRRDGFVIDLFRCGGLDGRIAVSREAAERIEHDIAGVLGGQIDLEKAFAANVGRWRRPAPAPRVPTVVEFENDLSRESTIVDLTAGDQPGLLYRAANILSQSGLDIQSAQLAAHGESAGGSFYVRTVAGKKLVSAAAMRAIRDKLKAALDARI